MLRRLLSGYTMALVAAIALSPVSSATPSNGSLLVPGDVQPGNYWATPVDPDGGYVEVCADYDCDVSVGMIENYSVDGRTMIVIPYNARMVNVSYALLTPANLAGGGALPSSSGTGYDSSAPAAASTPAVSNEQKFLDAAKKLPMYVRHDRYGGDPALLAQGYRACEALDLYPTDTERAALALYPNGNDINGQVTMDGDMFMIYASSYLCPQHSHLYENY